MGRHSCCMDLYWLDTQDVVVAFHVDDLYEPDTRER